MEPGLLLGATLTYSIAALLATLGVLVGERAAEGPARRALQAYAAWWFSGATLLAIIGTHTMMGFFGVTDVAAYVALQYAIALATAVALACLLHYLVFLLTGRSVVLPIVLLYAGYLVAENYVLASNAPWTLVRTTFEVHPAPLQEERSLGPVLQVLLVGPLVLGIASYAYAAWRGGPGPHRYRFLLLFLAFGGWSLGVLATFVLGWRTQPWYALAYLVPGVLAALVARAAFFPPPTTLERSGERA